MVIKKATVIVFITVLLCGANALPKHGNYKGQLIKMNGGGVDSRGNSSCASLSMIHNSPIRVSLRRIDFSKTDIKANIKVDISLYESQCENKDGEDCLNFATFYSRSRLVATNTVDQLEVTSDATPIPFMMKNTAYIEKSGNKVKRGTKEPATPEENAGSGDGPQPTIIYNYMNNTRPNWRTFTTNTSGIYVVTIAIMNKVKMNNYTLIFDVEMRNSFGYISLVDYPALITFGLLLVVYVFYSFVWLLMMACYYKDIIRLQFWILAVIFLGFLEKIFFVAEYGSTNEGHDSSGLIYIAEGVSAGKRALARILVIVVAEGFGTVKPRLGSTLTKVLVVGGIYFVIAFIDGITRASLDSTSGYSLSSIVTEVLLVVVDIGVIYWIFSALVNTRRALRLRKNTVKLSLYNHLAYALVATVVAALVFTIWEFVTIVRDDCISDWSEIWVKDCFWHILFCFILFVIMIYWRPSANSIRFAYSQVNVESDEEQEQGANKNFETMKMRNITKPDGPKALSMSQEAEDDLKWAEENLPTTLIDKTLPVVLDSEEEVMTTRFEASKMN